MVFLLLFYIFSTALNAAHSNKQIDKQQTALFLFFFHALVILGHRFCRFLLFLI